MVENMIFVEKTFAECSLVPCQRMPHLQISRRKLLLIATKSWNSRKFSPSKVSRYMVVGVCPSCVCECSLNIQLTNQTGYGCFLPRVPVGSRLTSILPAFIYHIWSEIPYMITIGGDIHHIPYIPLYRSLRKVCPLTKERPPPTFGPISCIGHWVTENMT